MDKIIFIILISILIFFTLLNYYIMNNVKGFEKCQLLEKNNELQKIKVKSIYDYRVSKELKNMFIEPSINYGYQSFNEE